MNLMVISYSLTGNNQALAESVAQTFGAQHISVMESKRRKVGKIAQDVLFCRTPKVEPSAETLHNADAVILVGPIWMGLVATPLRAFMHALQKLTCPYAFLSISGGADGGNKKIADDLMCWVKREPEALIDLHIADLLPSNPKPERKDTAAYQLSSDDIAVLTQQAVQKLRTMAGKDDQT